MRFAAVFFALMVGSSLASSQVEANELENEPNADSSVDYVGVTSEMWSKIDGLPEPLNCKGRVDAYKFGPEGHVLDSCNGDCINNALQRHDVVTLAGAKYNTNNTIKIRSGQVLKGRKGIKPIIYANGVDRGVDIDEGMLANVEIQFAEDRGIRVRSDSTIYRVVVGNTGVNPRSNRSGAGISLDGPDARRNCIVSAELYGSYNESGGGCSACANGGNADGLRIAFGARNNTVIDVHMHHNSDDGLDLWKGGDDAPYNNIRIFYSSASHNGDHPTKSNGDGNGFKFGSSEGGDNGARYIYGSAACYNANRGFDRNRSRASVKAVSVTATGNRLNFFDVPTTDLYDPDSVVCGSW